MFFCIAVFRSRTQVLEFIDYMTAAGIYASAVNTPVEAHIGCGISAKFYAAHIGYAKEVVARKGIGGFVGFYRIERTGKRTQVFKI
ncbi:MAG: DUF3343 domain-containing protein [Clostridia bacterium]|nr:DUF3343 domain-containing protein [Clostridia bacterium]